MTTPAESGDQSSSISSALINPYAPSTTVLDRTAAVDLPRVSVIVVVLSTIGGVTFSGGVFGVGIVMGSPRLVATMALAGFVIGCILAFTGAMVVVPLVLTTRYFFGLSGRDWSVSQIYRFGAICGGLTGFLCVVVPTGFQPAAMAFALIPAIVGSIFTTLLLIPLARRVKKRENRLAEALATDPANDFSL